MMITTCVEYAGPKSNEFIVVVHLSIPNTTIGFVGET